MWQIPSSACPSSPAAHIKPLSNVLQAPGARQKLLDRLAEAEAQQEASRGRGRYLPPASLRLPGVHPGMLPRMRLLRMGQFLSGGLSVWA